MNRDFIGRVAGLTLFTSMLIRQLLVLQDIKMEALPLIRWLLITILFTLFLSAYFIRSQAKSYAVKYIEIFLPLFCAGLPMGIILFPSMALKLSVYGVDIKQYSFLFEVYTMNFMVLGLSIMALGEIITVIGMLSLKRSFSILSEVRELVTHGIYRFIRHPLYSGEIISMIGFFIFYPCHWTLITVALFVILQSSRARVEENKISAIYPEYSVFKKATGFIWPSFPGYKKNRK
jgi:protein-S-isoprenylcysteine O-methyltransferase Ste14